MRIPDEVIMEIKYKNPIEEVISPYVNLKRAGRNLNGLCPFHNEKTPSFTVYGDTGSFYCFGCGAGGDAVAFIRKIENLDYVEALKKLADRAGVTIPEGDFDDSYMKLKARIFEINRETARFFHSQLFLPEGKWALDYLTGRGLTIQTIKHFGLGVAPNQWDALLKHLKALGFTQNEMEQANVITKGKSGGYYDRFRNRAMFPIIELSGRVVGFSGRRHPDDDNKGGKYINTSDTPVYKKSKTLFGFNFAKAFAAKRLIVVEGNMDVVSLHQAGFENTIGTLGTAFTPEQARMIARYTSEIVLCFDSDSAGQKATSRAMEVLSQSGLKVKVISVPEGKDPDEFIKTHGKERFEAILEGAVSEIEFKLYKAAEGLDTETSDGKAQFLNRAAEELSTVNDELAVDLYAGSLSDKYKVSKETIIKRVNILKAEKRRAGRRKEIREIINPTFKTNDINPEKRTHLRAVLAEEEILSVIIAHPDLVARLGDLTPESFISSLNKRVFEAVVARLNVPGGIFDISLFGEDFSPDEMGYLSSLQNGKGPFINPRATLSQATEVLKEEKENSASTSLDDEEWKKQMQKLIDNKRSN